MYTNSRFEINRYGEGYRAAKPNSDAISAWWSKSVRETMAKNTAKNLTNSNRLEKGGFSDLVNKEPEDVKGE